MLRRTNQLLKLTLLHSLIVFGSVSTAAAFTTTYIDNFNVGSVDYQSPGATTFSQGEVGLSTSDVLSGNRTTDVVDMILNTRIDVNSSDHPGQLFFETGAESTFTMTYSFSSSTDLIALGDRFRLDVDGIGNVALSISVNDGTPVLLSGPIVSPENDLLFSAFGAGYATLFQSVDKIELIGVAGPGSGGRLIQLDSFAVVPEPGTAGMLTLGLFGLAVASPRRRIAA